MNRIAACLMVVWLLGGCATREVMTTIDLEPGQLPPPDTALHIPGMGPCTDSPDRTLKFNSSQPVNVLVPGCFGSSGRFRGLAQVFAFHGQQSACYSYDDRARLTESAAGLRGAIKQLAEQGHVPRITVIGHGLGALIARKSLTESVQGPLPNRFVDLRLVTVSGPFSGIESARTCGRAWLYPLTLGLLPLGCYVATGPKWADIIGSSRFILEPGELSGQIVSYLKIDTDERGTCRREEAGHCVEGDDISSLAEQRNALVETDSRLKRVQVNAGHVEIVGDTRVTPRKLIAILQDQGVLRPTAPERLPAFDLLLSQIYLDSKTH